MTTNFDETDAGQEVTEAFIQRLLTTIAEGPVGTALLALVEGRRRIVVKQHLTGAGWVVETEEIPAKSVAPDERSGWVFAFQRPGTEHQLGVSWPIHPRWWHPDEVESRSAALGPPPTAADADVANQRARDKINRETNGWNL